MDFQFWIWLIAVVAMVLARALKKPAKGGSTPEQQPRNDGDRDYDQSSGKPMTFEELLREIQESKTPRQPATVKQKYQSPLPPKKSYDVDYDDDLEEEEKGYETIPANNDNRSTEIYEKAKREAFSRPSLEETLKLEDTIVKFDHFKGYDEPSKKSVASDVLRDLKDPEGFKKAFIMSEILKRKF